MYAIIKTGGKQYRVKKGDIIDVELLTLNEGETAVEFGEVLFYTDGKKSFKHGKPSISGFSVKGELLGTVAGPKITSVKYRPSHHQYRKFGHRQHYSRVKITAIGE